MPLFQLQYLENLIFIFYIAIALDQLSSIFFNFAFLNISAFAFVPKALMLLHSAGTFVLVLLLILLLISLRNNKHNEQIDESPCFTPISKLKHHTYILEPK